MFRFSTGHRTAAFRLLPCYRVDGAGRLAFLTGFFIFFTVGFVTDLADLADVTGVTKVAVGAGLTATESRSVSRRLTATAGAGSDKTSVLGKFDNTSCDIAARRSTLTSMTS